MTMERRDFIKFGLSGCVLLSSPFSLAADSRSKPRKIVWVMLRGAMDSLHAIVPSFDPDLSKHRQALLKPLADTLLPLESGYHLHPALKNMHQWYQQKQMIPVVAVASPYRSRSHFAAQDMLESGLSGIEHDNGWLARALGEYQGEAFAIARSVPISLRGSPNTRTWYPSNLPEADIGLYQQLVKLYQNDPALMAVLEQGIRTRKTINMSAKSPRKPKFSHLAQNCGELLAANPNTSCAMLEMGGWDTHNSQVSRLNKQFSQLDEGLASLRVALADQWQQTIVLVATEFGRTVAVNGTFGTDHGTASALMVLGGALKGGRVAGQWPGLKPEDLFEGRDLKPTSDIRSWIATILRQHWHLNDRQISSVFPDVTPIAQQLI